MTMRQPAMKPATLPVLLIEDEPAVMAYVRAALERSGYVVVCTESGAEGLKLLESEEFLGVVSDMRTPGGVDGADVHAWIAAIVPIWPSASFSSPVTSPMKKPSRRCAKPARPAWRNPFACNNSFQSLKRP